MKPYPFESLNHFTVPVAIEKTPPSTTQERAEEAHAHPVLARLTTHRSKHSDPPSPPAPPNAACKLQNPRYTPARPRMEFAPAGARKRGDNEGSAHGCGSRRLRAFAAGPGARRAAERHVRGRADDRGRVRDCRGDDVRDDGGAGRAVARRRIHGLVLVDGDRRCDRV